MHDKQLMGSDATNQPLLQRGDNTGFRVAMTLFAFLLSVFLLTFFNDKLEAAFNTLQDSSFSASTIITTTEEIIKEASELAKPKYYRLGNTLGLDKDNYLYNVLKEKPLLFKGLKLRVRKSGELRTEWDGPVLSRSGNPLYVSYNGVILVKKGDYLYTKHNQKVAHVSEHTIRR